MLDKWAMIGHVARTASAQSETSSQVWHLAGKRQARNGGHQFKGGVVIWEFDVSDERIAATSQSKWHDDGRSLEYRFVHELCSDSDFWRNESAPGLFSEDMGGCYGFAEVVSICATSEELEDFYE